MICDSDLADMIQTAAIAIWSCGSGKREAYYFSAGRFAAQNWLTWWKYGAPRDKLRGLMGKIQTPLSLDWLRRYQSPRLPELPKTMTVERVKQLRKIFWMTRRKHGPREIAGIERDILICQGLLAGDTPEGIGMQLDLNPHMIGRYRAEIRKRLQKYLRDRYETE